MAITVRNKRTGQLGEAADLNFNPKEWEQVQQPKKEAKKGFIEKYNILPAAGGALGFLSGGGPITAAVGAGLGDALEQLLYKRPRGEAFNPLSTAGEAAFAGIGGPLISKGLGLVGEAAAPAVRQLGEVVGLKSIAPQLAESLSRFGLTPVGEALPSAATGLAGAVQSKAAASFLKPTQAAVKGALESGVNIPEAFSRWAPQLGNSYDDALKAIPQLLKSQEGVISQVAKSVPEGAVIPGDAVISSLQNELASLGGQLGSSSKAEALKNIIAEAEKKYAGGITVQAARDIVKSANMQFGKSVVETEGGAIASAAQKLEANTLRKVLRTVFPQIGAELDKQRELLILRPVLENAKASAVKAGFNFGRLDITRPGTLLDSILGNQAVSRGLVGATQPVQGAGRGATAAGLGLLRPILSGGGETQQPGALPGAGLPQQVSPLSQVAPQLQQAITPEMVTQAYLSLPGEDAKRIEAAYNAQSLGKPTSANAQFDKFITDATDNINELSQVSTLGYGPVKGRLLDFQINTLGGGGNVDQSAVALNQRYKLLKLNILRAFQGARISDADYELANYYMPNLSETNETAKTKLEVLNEILTKSVAPQQTQSPQSLQTSQFQQLFQSLGLPLQ